MRYFYAIVDGGNFEWLVVLKIMWNVKSLQIKAIMVERKHKYFPSDISLVRSKVKVCVYQCNYRMTHILCPCFVQETFSCSPCNDARPFFHTYTHTFIYKSRRFFIKMFYRIQVAILKLPKNARFIRSSLLLEPLLKYFCGI